MNINTKNSEHTSWESEKNSRRTLQSHIVWVYYILCEQYPESEWVSCYTTLPPAVVCHRSCQCSTATSTCTNLTVSYHFSNTEILALPRTHTQCVERKGSLSVDVQPTWLTRKPRNQFHVQHMEIRMWWKKTSHEAKTTLLTNTKLTLVEAYTVQA